MPSNEKHLAHHSDLDNTAVLAHESVKHEKLTWLNYCVAVFSGIVSRSISCFDER